MIKSERLFLRPWTTEDISNYKTLQTDVGYNCFSIPGTFLCKNDDEIRERIQKRINLFTSQSLSKFLIFEKSTQSLIGTCGVDPFELDGKTEPELGYRILLPAWGKGYATEAARAYLDHYFQELKQKYVYGLVLPQNKGSIDVLKKLSFQYQRAFIFAGLPHQLYHLEK